jgi:hypothetical protein
MFGPTSREARDAPDTAELAEEVILWMIERSKGCSVDTGDVASLLALEWWRRWPPITARHCRSSWRRSQKPPQPARRWCAKPTSLDGGRRR